MNPQTLYYGDCLDWMRQWPDSSVDLIYLDPPFNSNANYNILFGEGNGVPAQVRAFQDTWKWDAAAIERTRRIVNAVAHPAHRVITGLRAFLGDSGMLAYLSYLADRLARNAAADEKDGHYLFALRPHRQSLHQNAAGLRVWGQPLSQRNHLVLSRRRRSGQ